MAGNFKKSKYRPKPNYWLSNVSVTLLLFLAGLLGLSWLHSNELINYLKENVNLTVELHRDIKNAELKKVTSSIKELDGVKAGSVQLISKEEGFQNLKSEFGEDFLDDDFPNPLQDMIVLNLNAVDVEKKKVDALKSSIRALSPGVSQVYFQDELFDTAIRNMNLVNWGMTVIGFLILLIAVFLIHNTIKLSLYSNRFVVKTMELVGARWGFIIRPFLSKSLVYGLICGIIAILALAGLGYYIYYVYPSILTIFNPQSTMLIMAGVLILGLLIQAVSTVFVVNKYLRKNMSDLF
ncbi:permease-like cell division protein FtsX [Membranicola marinus]|uniref:Cell division protein FtsX n=1 Tax=Membranihabitans marinus TaxID=1227546 RepID=A0A953LAB6_9BACT|nr:permease-like cell division protein FtsX [Membranihabitans marinus]MBY5959760.1 permease-like cell division protein FtsX [Membranihabitans marinus]